LGHMGRYRVELDLATSPTLRQFYSFHWILAGNLGVDLLILPLGRVFGLEPAVKLIAIAVPVIGAIGLLSTAREVHGALPPTAPAALAFVLGFPLAFGFINFSLGMSLALCAFALCHRLAGRASGVGMSLLFVVISGVLWLCHVYGWALFVVLVVGSELPQKWDARLWWMKFIRLSPLSVPLLPMLLWRSGESSATGRNWFNFSQKIDWIEKTLEDHWRTPDLLMVVAASALLLFALVSKRLEFDRRLKTPMMMLIVAFLIIPEQLLGSSYADARLLPYIFAIGFIAIKPVRASLIAGCATLLFSAKIATFAAGLWFDSRDIDDALVAVTRLPIGARVASIATLPCDGWRLPKLSHIGGLVIVRKQGFSNEQWVGPGLNPLRTTPAYSGPMTRDWSELAKPPSCAMGWPLVSEKLSEVPRTTFDYIWIIDGGHPPVPGAILVGVFGRTSLYKLISDG
ncbi:MAG: hypothetical protein ABIO85_08795, partial [Sphingomicrobium sp.]